LSPTKWITDPERKIITNKEIENLENDKGNPSSLRFRLNFVTPRQDVVTKERRKRSAKRVSDYE
jgi:hypothetical protein